MNKVLTFLLLITILHSCKNKDSGSLNLVLIDDEIKIKSFYRGHLQPCLSMCADIRYKVENTSSKNYLLYNFNRNLDHGNIEDSIYCRDINESGIVMFVYQENIQKMATFIISDSTNWKPWERIQEMLQNEYHWHKSTKLIANVGENYNYVKRVDFWAFDLVPGQYILKILYYQGGVNPYIDQSQIERDEMKFSAEIFQGCLWSNPIKLIVE